MRPCVPSASASDHLARDPPRVRVGGWRASAFAAIVASVWLAPLESSAQHFYAGLGYGLERPLEAEPAAEDCSRVWLAPRSGCETGGDRAPFRIFGKFSIAPSMEPGDAPVVGRIEKIEWLAEQGSEFALEDSAESIEPEKRRSLSRFISPSFDISTFGVPGQGALNPFIGGGMGAVRTGSGEAPVTSSWDTGRFVPGASKVGTAWMVTAGVAATLGARTTVELSWRYNHLGEAKTGRGSGRVEWRERGQPIPTNLAPTSEEAKSHGVRLSLHYGF